MGRLWAEVPIIKSSDRPNINQWLKFFVALSQTNPRKAQQNENNEELVSVLKTAQKKHDINKENNEKEISRLMPFCGLLQCRLSN